MQPDGPAATKTSAELQRGHADEVSSRPAHWREKREFTKEEMKAFWNKKKQQRKERQRNAKKESVAEKQQSWENLSQEEREAMRQRAVEVHEARRRQERDHDEASSRRLASLSTPTIVFDLGFVHVMNERDCRSTMSQLKYSYSILRHSAFLMKPFITKFDADHPVVGTLASFEGFKRFPFPMDPRACVECFADAHKAGKLVYLTADTDQVLSSIEPDHVYVVGAFVDHNAHKGLTRGAADSAGIRTARLPLTENIAVGNRCKVLTINHVADVLIRFLQTNDWREAFSVLPTRRVNEKKHRSTAGSDAGSIDEEQEDGGDA
jgi:tRNA (guanine9-N1)-methyltransferase